jgi:quercetin dioxygenase-like cupin family protein
VKVFRGGPPADPASTEGPTAVWLQGPAAAAGSLDVGVVTLAPGASTPRHRHESGQVLVVTSGEGFVETDGERVSIAAGDIVMAAAGEWHVHGATGQVPLVHLTVTTGTHEVAGPA